MVEPEPDDPSSWQRRANMTEPGGFSDRDRRGARARARPDAGTDPAGTDQSVTTGQVRMQEANLANVSRPLPMPAERDYDGPVLGQARLYDRPVQVSLVPGSSPAAATVQWAVDRTGPVGLVLGLGTADLVFLPAGAGPALDAADQAMLAQQADRLFRDCRGWGYA